MTAEKEVYIYPCQANTAMTIAVGDSCLLVSNAQAREMVDRIQEVLVAAECLMNSLLDLPPSDMALQANKNLCEFSDGQNDDFDFNDSLAGQVAKIMRRHNFDFDQAMAIMKMARDTNAPN